MGGSGGGRQGSKSTIGRDRDGKGSSVADLAGSELFWSDPDPIKSSGSDQKMS